MVRARRADPGPPRPRTCGGWSASTRSTTSETMASNAWRGAQRRGGRARRWGPFQPRAGFADAHFDDRLARGVRLEDKDAIWAFHWRGVSDPDSARGLSRRWPRRPMRRPRPALGPHGARDPPDGNGRQGHRRHRCTRRRAGRCRALRRRRHDGSGRLPAPCTRSRRGVAGARLRVGAASPEGPAEIAARRTSSWTIPTSFASCSRAGELKPVSLALHRLPQVNGDADGRRGNRAGGGHVAAAAGDTTTIIFALAWWTLAALIGIWLGRRQETTARSAGCSHRRAPPPRCRRSGRSP